MSKPHFCFLWYGFAGSNSRIDGVLDYDMVEPIHKLLMYVAEGKIDGVKLSKAIPDLMREDKPDG